MVPPAWYSPQKAAAPAADDYGRHLLLVLLHVDAAAVARVLFNVDGAAPHGVACGVPAGAVDDDFPAVHGVAGGVLGVAEHLHRGAVQVGAQGVARHLVHGIKALSGPGGDVPLAQGKPCLCLHDVSPFCAGASSALEQGCVTPALFFPAKAKRDARHLPRAVFLGKRRTPLSVAKKYTPHPAESQDAFAQHSGTSCRNNFTRGFQ